MPNPTTIELPRIEGESARAYAARVEYVTMGAGRSIDKLADQQGRKRGSERSRSTTLLDWSSKYNWAESARQYDEQVAYITIQEAQAQYRADLEKHRTEASEAGHALYTVSGQLIKAINEVLKNPRKIKGEDGKWYTIHAIELNANTFAIAARGMQTALDLKAHSLNLDKLLPSLTDDSE